MPSLDWPTIQGAAVSLVGVVLSICLPIVARAAVGWLNAHREEIESRIADTLKMDPWQLDDYVKRGVLAAEGIFASDAGQQKKKWVIDLVQAWLKRRNVSIDLEEIDAAVEAAVFSELNKDKAPEAPKA